MSAGKWVPYYSDGNLYHDRKFLPIGWYVRKDGEINYEECMKTKKEAYGKCKRLNHPNQQSLEI